MQCMTDLSECASAEAVELIGLLSRFEVEGLLYAHDRIAELSTIAPANVTDSDTETDGGVAPESAFISNSATSGSAAHPATPANAHPADKTFKIIRLEKSNEPLVNFEQWIKSSLTWMDAWMNGLID